MPEAFHKADQRDDQLRAKSEAVLWHSKLYKAKGVSSSYLLGRCTSIRSFKDKIAIQLVWKNFQSAALNVEDATRGIKTTNHHELRHRKHGPTRLNSGGWLPIPLQSIACRRLCSL